jgi:hypothetical protein
MRLRLIFRNKVAAALGVQMSLINVDDLTRITGGSYLRTIRIFSVSVNVVTTAVVIALAAFGVIPIWLAAIIWIASLFLSRYAALLILRFLLESGGFYVLCFAPPEQEAVS